VNLRRTLALGAAGLAATVTLSACGFDYPTDRINNLTSGANDRNGTVEVLNAAVVAQKAGAGTFVAGFANNNQTQAVRVTGMTSNSSSVSSVHVKPFEIPPNGFVNLADHGGAAVSGTFALGDFVNITVSYDNGETSSVGVPVVRDSGQWSGLYAATSSPSPTAPTSGPTGGQSGGPTASGSPASPTASGS
jgi:hypothetical protein